jgi:uncharacterized protein YbaR (Trm112 family)
VSDVRVPTTAPGRKPRAIHRQRGAVAEGCRLCYISKKVTLMPLSQDLLEMLVCPVCKEPVQLLDDQSGLKCRRCRRVYPVRDDIPVMLPEEATIAED